MTQPISPIQQYPPGKLPKDADIPVFPRTAIMDATVHTYSMSVPGLPTRHPRHLATPRKSSSTCTERGRGHEPAKMTTTKIACTYSTTRRGASRAVRRKTWTWSRCPSALVSRCKEQSTNLPEKPLLSNVDPEWRR